MNPSYSELFSTFGRIGIYSFGGPAAQIALMHRELVERKGWIEEEDFLSALSFCMLLPGPEAMQLATYTGWRLNGVHGALTAGLLFVFPGAIAMFAISAIYAIWRTVPLVEGVFFGVQCTVVAIVIEALFKVSKKALKAPDRWLIAALSFLALFAFGVPFPAIIALSAIWGFIFAHPAANKRRDETTASRVHWPILVFGALWIIPFVVLWATNSTFLWNVAVFFSKLAVVTFGGAYAVLAYMAQEVVAEHGWISTAQMMDGLALAETTPGPLILVTQFVGFQAGYAAGGMPLAIIAALITLWVTFVPCFLWIFAGAPFLPRLTASPRISGALSAITAAVVGVILNLSVWFAANVLFRDIGKLDLGPLSVLTVDLASVDWSAVGLTSLGIVSLLVLRFSLGATLLIGAAAGLSLNLSL
ncbi:MAG: chromate efflux transporter [Boseongicola sp.]